MSNCTRCGVETDDKSLISALCGACAALASHTSENQNSSRILDVQKTILEDVRASIMEEINRWGKEKTFFIFKSPMGQLEAVKIGWSWPAFLFLALWAAVKKFWVKSAIFFVVGFTLSLLGNAGLFLILGPQIYAATRGYKWRKENLISRGYAHVATVSGLTQEGALNFYSINKGASTAAPPCARDLSLDAYKIWLVSKYLIAKNDVLGGYVCNNSLFPTTEEALSHAHSLELAAVAATEAAAQEAARRREW